MKLKGLYTYDSKNYCYREVSVFEVVKKAIKTSLFVGGFTFASLVALSHSGIWDANEVVLEQKEKQILSEIRQIETNLNAVEKELTSYYNNYNDFYANILPLKKIDEGTWNAGVGGSKIYPYIKDEKLRSLLVKSDKLE